MAVRLKSRKAALGTAENDAGRTKDRFTSVRRVGRSDLAKMWLRAKRKAIGRNAF
jgi:hypothetical protein